MIYGPDNEKAFDNPLQSILSENLGKGTGPKNISEYLWAGVRGAVSSGKTEFFKLGGLSSNNLGNLSKGNTKATLRKPMAQFLRDIDPYEVGLNSSRLERITFGSQEYSDLTKNLGGRAKRFLDKLSGLSFTDKDFGDSNPILLWDKSRRALFYGHEATGFAPVPISGQGLLDSNIVNIGYTRVSSSGFRSDFGSKSFIDLAYKALKSSTDDYFSTLRSLRKIRKLNLPGKNIKKKELKLRSMLRSGTTFRGMDISFYSAMMGSSELYNIDYSFGGFAEIGVSPIRAHHLVNKLENITAALNTLRKTGKIVDSGDINLQGLSKVEAFDRLTSLVNEFPKELSNILYGGEQVNDFYAYLKAEYLLGVDKNLFLPNVRLLKDVFGDLPLHEGALKKGMFHMSKVGPIQRSQVSRLGTRAFPRYILNSFADIAESSSIENLALRGLPLTIGVLDTTDELASRLLTQEGGQILTPLGEKFLRQQVFSGQAVFGASDLAQRAKLEDFLEAITGKKISLASFANQTLNLETTYSNVDVDRAINKHIKTKDLTDTQKSLRKTLLKGKGRGRRAHHFAGTIKAMAGHTLTTVESRGDSIVLNFKTTEDYTPGAYELVTGARRSTAVRPTDSHYLKELANKAGIEGVHMLVGKDEFMKMSPGIILVETFFEQVSRHPGGKAIIESITGGKYREIVGVGSQGNITRSVPALGSLKEAVEKIKRLLSSWENGSDPGLKSLAEKILKGEKLNPEAFQAEMQKAGVAGIRIFHTSGGMRADFMGDINLLRSQRFGVQKLLTMGAGTRLLGYDTPMDHPVFRMFYDSLLRSRPGQFRIDSETLTLRFARNSELKEILEKMAGIGLTVSDRRKVARLENGKIIYKDNVLDSVPSLESFRFKETGGIEKQALKNTVVGKGTVFLDLGKSVRVKIGDKETTIRHLPIASNYLSLDKSMSGRVIVGKTSPAYNLINLINRLEAGEDPGGLAEDIGTYITRFTKEIPRKTKNRAGILEKQTTTLVSMATRVRLIPQRGSRFNRKNFSDVSQAFEVNVGQAEIMDYLARKETIDPEGVKAIREKLDKKGFTYTLLTADPTQRPEHQIVVKLFMDREISKSKIGQLNLSMHPVLFRMFERDTDRDAIIAYLLEGMGKKINPEELETLYKKQQELLKPFLAWHHYELLNKGPVENFLDAAKKHLISAGDIVSGGRLSEYLSQKMEAATGYNIKRAFDDWINVLAFGDEEEVAKMAIKPEAKALATQYRQSITKQKMGIVDAAFQAVYQSGVSKGKISNANILARSLLDISERAVKEGMSLEQITDLAQVSVKQFLTTESKDKRREIFAMAHALKLSGDENFNAVDEILKDLQNGADYNSIAGKIDKLGDKTIEVVSRIMAETLGVGAALNEQIGKKPVNLVRQVRSRTSSKINPLTQIAEMIDESDVTPGASSPASDTLKEAATRVSSWQDIINNITKNKYALGIGAGAATLGAIGLGIGSMDPQISPPPPIDVSQPMDIGPQIGPLSNNLRLDSSRPVALSAKSSASGNRSYGNVVQINGNQSFVNLNIRDTTRVIHPYSLESNARRSMNSDF